MRENEIQNQTIDVVIDAIQSMPYIIPPYLVDFAKEEIFAAILKDRKQTIQLLEGVKNGNKG